MSFAPVVPFGGVAGWTFLKRTLPSQRAAFEAAPANQRDEAYFREKIGKITTAEALVSDRRLLKVALGAFGLEADINNRYFIRKVLEEGTLNADALANKLANKQYEKLSAAFGFALGAASTQISGFADKILAQYDARQFETAVGAQNDDMRLISAWAAVAAVPTLLAGIWGMNFRHMPELDWLVGYPLALALIVAASGALAAFFRRRRWI